MIIHLKTILCAIDFSQFTPQMVHYGVGLAKMVGARLLIFHSVNYPEDELYASPAAEHGIELRKMGQRADQKIKQIMKPYDVDWMSAITQGDPVEKVSQVAQREDVDLVMAVSHNISGLKRLLMGTVVERMARGLAFPFLVIRPKKRFKIFVNEKSFSLKKMVVGCDLSSEISPALEYARYFARFFNAEIHLLHTMESPVNEDIVDRTEGSYGEVQQRLRQRIYDRLLNLCADKGDSDLTFKIVLETGLPEEALSRYARQQSADLMIVGLKRHGALEKILVGSTTEAVIRHSPCPVLVVPPDVAPKKRFRRVKGS
ncbi:MAG: universal stress protein [Desulfobacterales bacterium]